MAKISSHNITSLDQDWGYDPIDQAPFSGSSVQAFIKQYLGAISKAAWFDPNTYTMYWFATESDRDAFINDRNIRTVLFSTTMSFASEMSRIALVNNVSGTSLNYATNEDSINLSVSFDVQTKNMSETSWHSTGKGVYVDTFIDVGATGVYEPLYTRAFLPAESTYNVDVRNNVDVGITRIKIQFTAEDDETVTTSITYTISMTEMYIEPLNNEWYKPIIEGGDISNYKLGGFRIIGAINKTLHLDVYSGESRLLSFEKILGQTVYDRVPYYYTQNDGFDLSSLGSGVYTISAYLTSGTIISQPVNYTIIHIAENDVDTAQYVCINEVEDVIYNYTTSKLFAYSIYNKGLLSGTPIAIVRHINGTTTASTRTVELTDVSVGESHNFNMSVEWLTEESLNLFLQTTLTFGNEQIAIVGIDNSSTFPPTYGYEFYMNAAARSNSDLNLTKLINVANNTQLNAEWERMAWIDGVDGWTEDDTNRRTLYIPAGSKLTLPYNEYKILNGDGITFEICYKVSNVADYSENIITICDNPDSPGFRGIRIKPTNITVHSSNDNTSSNDLVRGTNLMDEQVIHFLLTIYPNYNGNGGKNLVTGYVNGSKNFQFAYESGAIWSTEANLVVGAEKSDISLYFIRVYRSVLSDAAAQANYINSLRTIAERTELSELFKSVMDVSQTDISYESVRDNNKNFFVIEMANNASVPSRANGWSKDQTGLSTLEMHYGGHPDWDWKIENVETSGQGTTSMNYYRWNLRWRIDKTSGKKCNISYLNARRQRAGSYIYDWNDSSLSGSVIFDGNGNNPPVKRITAKTNMASSMQSHKIGATRAFTELHNAIGLQNEAQIYADQNELPIPSVAVYQHPAYGFVKQGDYYSFIGLFTIGPDKGDKPTFGFDINNDIKENLITIEGTDHSRKMVMFNYPWNEDVQYLASNECLNIVKGANDYDNGWEIGNCHGYSTDEPDDQAAIDTILNTEFKPAYNVAYENSTLIIGIPIGEYGNSATATWEYINNNISTFQSQLDADNRFTYANYQFWLEGEFILYYFDIISNTYKPNQNLITQNGYPVGVTVAEQNEWFKEQRRNRFRTEAQSYWDISDTIFQYDFNILTGAMDNFGKNTYPYKMKTLADGGKWKWRQDDLDSIAGIGNAGADNMPSWMEFEDSDNGSVYFGGSTSVFWNLIHECYMDDYINATTGAIRPGILSIGKSMLEAMSNIAGGTNVYDGAMLYIKQRFWDNAQNYFPQSAYNADAIFKYETAWISNGQEVAPLTQSLGNHLSAEELWFRKRIIYVMSLFKAGPFGSYADTSLGQIAFRPQSLQSLTVTPETELYPAFASGQGMISTDRTGAGEPHTFVGPFGTDGQTTHYINASNLLKNLGDWKNLVLGSQYINPIQIQGKKLVVFKIGDENATLVIVPAEYYTTAEVNAHNSELEGAIVSGTSLTAEQAILVNTALSTTYTENDIISEEDANVYNTALEGAISTEDIKIPAVTTPNVTTNVPGISFDNTSCLEKIDARNAASLTGTVDISNCNRLKEAYFEGTSLTQIKTKNGQKIEKLHYPDGITNISLKNLKFLEDLQLPTDIENIVLLDVVNTKLNPLTLLYELFNTENSQLRYINLGLKEPINVNQAGLDILVAIANNKNVDGDDIVYGGVLSDGSPAPTAKPTISGTIVQGNGFYNSTMEALGAGEWQNYDGDLKITRLTKFDGLSFVTNPTNEFIEFIDPEVKRICSNTWGTEDGLTINQAANITNAQLGNTFSGNKDMTSFDEFQYFTKITNLGNGETNAAFYNCTNIERISLPPSLTTFSYGAFNGDSKLQEITIPGVVSSTTAVFRGCTRLNKLNITSLENYLKCNWGSNTEMHPFGMSNSGSLYLNGTEITEITSFPSTITQLKNFAFYGCTGLTKIVIPSNITSIGMLAFGECSQLDGEITIPSTVSLGSRAFDGCSSLTSLYIYSNISDSTLSFVNSIGNGTGTLYIDKDYQTAQRQQKLRFKTIIFNGDLIYTYQNWLIEQGATSIRVGGNVSCTNAYGYLLRNTGQPLKFLEIGGTVSATIPIIDAVAGYSASGSILHLGYNGIAGTPTVLYDSKLTKIYVGDGSSAEADQAVLDMYLADADWAQYASKLDLWYNYSGEFKEMTND